MNSTNYQHSLEEAERLLRQLDSSPFGFLINAQFWLISHPVAAWAILIIWLLVLLLTLVHLLHSFRGADRICWFLVVMGVPLFGIPLYWLIGSGERASESEADYLKRMGGGARRV